MIVLPATALTTRSVASVVPAFNQVCARPPRVMSSICMNFTQASVTGRRIRTVSPAANPLPSATVRRVAPEGT